MKYRLVGPFRGGRVTTVAGVPSEPFTFYFGSTGGGVWKTTSAGEAWKNISDGFFGVGSIGAIAVAPSDSNVVYAGTGSACPRGNISNGDGVYRSTDAGKTWQRSGLRGDRPDRQDRRSPTGPRSRLCRGPRSYLRTQRRSAVFIDRTTAAEPGTRCCTCPTRPAPWT